MDLPIGFDPLTHRGSRVGLRNIATRAGGARPFRGLAGRAYNTPMSEDAVTVSDAIAFPRLDAADPAALRPLATGCSYEDGEVGFRVGGADLGLFVVESGGLEILNPSC